MPRLWEEVQRAGPDALPVLADVGELAVAQVLVPGGAE